MESSVLKESAPSAYIGKMSPPYKMRKSPPNRNGSMGLGVSWGSSVPNRCRWHWKSDYWVPWFQGNGSHHRDMPWQYPRACHPWPRYGYGRSPWRFLQDRYHNETFIATLKLFLREKFQRGFVFGTKRAVWVVGNACINPTMKLSQHTDVLKSLVPQAFLQKEKGW